MGSTSTKARSNFRTANDLCVPTFGQQAISPGLQGQFQVYPNTCFTPVQQQTFLPMPQPCQMQQQCAQTGQVTVPQQTLPLVVGPTVSQVQPMPQFMPQFMPQPFAPIMPTMNQPWQQAPTMSGPQMGPFYQPYNQRVPMRPMQDQLYQPCPVWEECGWRNPNPPIMVPIIPAVVQPSYNPRPYPQPEPQPEPQPRPCPERNECGHNTIATSWVPIQRMPMQQAQPEQAPAYQKTTSYQGSNKLHYQQYPKNKAVTIQSW